MSAGAPHCYSDDEEPEHEPEGFVWPVASLLQVLVARPGVRQHGASVLPPHPHPHNARGIVTCSPLVLPCTHAFRPLCSRFGPRVPQTFRRARMHFQKMGQRVRQKDQQATGKGNGTKIDPEVAPKRDRLVPKRKTKRPSAARSSHKVWLGLGFGFLDR